MWEFVPQFEDCGQVAIWMTVLPIVPGTRAGVFAVSPNNEAVALQRPM